MFDDMDEMLCYIYTDSIMVHDLKLHFNNIHQISFVILIITATHILILVKRRKSTDERSKQYKQIKWVEYDILDNDNETFVQDVIYNRIDDHVGIRIDVETQITDVFDYDDHDAEYEEYITGKHLNINEIVATGPFLRIRRIISIN